MACRVLGTFVRIFLAYHEFCVKNILWLRSWVSHQCYVRGLIQTVCVLIDLKWFLLMCIVLEKRLIL